MASLSQRVILETLGGMSFWIIWESGVFYFYLYVFGFCHFISVHSNSVQIDTIEFMVIFLFVYIFNLLVVDHALGAIILIPNT